MRQSYTSFDIAKAFGKHNYQVNDVNYREKLLKHPILQGLFSVGHYFILAGNMQTMAIEFLGGDVEKITGYAYDEVLKMQGNFLGAFSHPDDIEFCLATIRLAIEYHQNRPDEEKSLIFVVYYYRAVRKDGKAVVIQHQSIPMMIDENGVPYVFANIITDITHLGLVKVPQSNLINRFTGEIFHIYPENLTLTKSENIFTTRELDIIRLLTLGFNSQKVADKLQISKETVRTHRKNILRKAGLSNTSQLVGYALTHSLL